MHTYNKYDNELTQYLSMLVDMDIKDYVGDIVGDIYSAEIPSNIPDATNIENQKIICYTPYGEAHIEYCHEHNDELLIFRRIVGGAIYEEYRISMLDLLVVPRIKGAIYEPRENGIILTDIERTYAKSPVDKSMRVISSRECRHIFSNKQLKGKGVDDKSIVFADPEHFNPHKLVSYVRNKKVRCSSYLLIEFSILPNNIKYFASKNQLEPSYTIDMVFNNRYNNWENFYNKRLEGPKLMERINLLIQGAIDSTTIPDIKTLMKYLEYDTTKISKMEKLYDNYWFKRSRYELLFDIFNSQDLEIFPNFKKGTWKDLTTHLIGPSKVKMEHEYYEYIKSLIRDAFPIDLPEDDMAPSALYNMLIKKYSK